MKALIYNPASSFWLNGAQADGDSDAAMTARRAYTATVIVYACIRYRYKKLVQSPLFVFGEDENGDREWVKGHPLQNVLEEPNPDQSMADLLTETVLYKDLYGRCLWLKTPDRGGRVAQLRAFSRDEFSVEPAPDGSRLYGQFRVALKGGSRMFAAKDVVFFRNAHPDRTDALAPTDVALSMLNIGDELRRRIKYALRNAAMPSGVFTTQSEAPLTDEQYTRARSELDQAVQGTRQTGRAMLMENASWTKMSMSIEELQGGPLWREVETAVCMAFDVRPELIGTMAGLENSPWSHLPEAKRLGYEDCILPLQDSLADPLTRQLLRPVDPDRSRVIAFDNSKIVALQPDQERMARVGRLAADVLDADERRAMIGREPLTSAQRAELAARKPVASPPAAEPVPAKAAAPVETKADGDAARWAAFDVLVEAQEAAWETAAAALLDADKAEMLQAARIELRADGKEDDPAASAESVAAFLRRVDDLAFETWWRAKMPGLIERTGARACKALAAELGVSFDLLQPGLLAYVEEHAAELVSDIADTTRSAIREAMSAGLEAGESVAKLTKRVQSSGAFARSRAELIARTETCAVTNGAARQSLSRYAADEPHATVTKRWLASQDARVREAHRKLNGETRGIDEAFSNGRQAPGEPNCLVPGTLVQGAFIGGLRVEYAGEVIVIHTAGGRELTVTPNHPVLTPGGFVPAKALRDGDDLLCHAGVVEGGAAANEDAGPTPIEQVFGALAKRFPELPTHALAAEDFHGDAVRMQGDVEVVGPHGVLLVHPVAGPTNERRDGVLVFSAVVQPLEVSASPLDLLFERVDADPRYGVGGPDLAGDSGRVALDLAPLQALRFGPGAEIDASRYQPPKDERHAVSRPGLDALRRLAASVGGSDGGDVNDSAPTDGSGTAAAARHVTLFEGAVELGGSDAEFLADLQDRFSGHVAADSIVSIERRAHSGHVYDLQSVGGWNIAGGIFTSNCRCTLTYALTTTEGDA